MASGWLIIYACQSEEEPFFSGFSGCWDACCAILCRHFTVVVSPESLKQCFSEMEILECSKTCASDSCSFVP